jgi:hypothetical protein|tara:strand:- start:93 stop:284 length:192 start_codon:yes stop_codon:yes gene_type:complete
MPTEYLDYLDCYEDTLMCLKKRVITEKEIPLLIEQYEIEEHYECCGAILHALEDYITQKNYLP